MSDLLPINPDILKWARETAGLSPGEVAEKLGRQSINAEVVTDWEAGTGTPNYPQLELLARIIYHRPLAVFFFPSVPFEDTPTTEFRTLPDVMIEELPAGIVRLYRKAKLFQLYLQELYEEERPVQSPLLDRFALQEGCELEPITDAIRAALGISIEEQAEWRSTETAAKRWREALEATGVFVFKDAFRNSDYSGFCLYHDKYPLIFANNSVPESRQVFTLFHELAHLLYHSGGVDFRSRDVIRSLEGYYLDVEVCANRFANEFLVPQRELDRFQLEVSEAAFDRLATYFSVSREVILRNYLERGLVDTDYYEQMAAKWTEQARAKKEEPGGGNYYYNVRTYLGEKYINLVYGQYYRNKIPIESVAEYLDVKAKNLPSFEHFVLEGGKP